MFYVALAQREDATFLTLDASLKKEAQRQGIRTLQNLTPYTKRVDTSTLDRFPPTTTMPLSVT
jgi:hypothetical protein